MANTLRHKGYIGSVEYDSEDNILHGKVIGINGVIAYAGHSIDELKQAFCDIVDEYLEDCAEMGMEPQKPYSGKISLRVPPEIHTKIALKAKKLGKSINAFISETLSHAV